MAATHGIAALDADILNAGSGRTGATTYDEPRAITADHEALRVRAGTWVAW